MNTYTMQDSKTLKVDGISDFSLRDIFDCGQCFRWNAMEDGSYSGVAFGKAVNVSYSIYDEQKKEGCLTIRNCTEEDFESIWKKYFDLDRDYGEIKRLLSENDPVMKKALAFGGGIRILNQNEWETLISFILSQNRNIPLIKKSIEEICRKFGKEIKDYEGNVCYTFPEPEVLAEVKEEDLAECRLGYRTGYVIKTAQVIAENPGRLYEMTKALYEEAFEFLKSLHGVGPKVANCVLLFSMEKYASFPIDVWVKRLMSVLYGIDENDLKGIKAYADNRFGNLGGFAQQYLFYYARENNIGKKTAKGQFT